MRPYLTLSLFFLATRLALAAAGFRLNFEIGWMFLCDPNDLKTRLFECVYYFHAYPPGMNLLTGLVLKLAGAHAATLALVVFWALGLTLVNALYYLLRAGDLAERASLIVAGAFSLLPQTLYLEHLYHYEHLVAALLTLGAAQFYAAVCSQRAYAYLAFFATCALIGWLRSSFHLVWFLAMLALALWFGRGAGAKRVLLASAAPAALLLALYCKNYALFGVFGATSAGGGNLTHVTVSQLSSEERAAWVAEGKLSSLALLHVYAGPSEYLPYFPAHVDGRSPILDATLRPSIQAPNYNHWVMIPALRQRRSDALAYLRQRPFGYLATVWRSFRQLFGPVTEWHPRHGTPRSSHADHERVLGPYTHAYNALVHAGPGLYVLLPLACAWALRRILRDFRAVSRAAQARVALLAFALCQLAYVVATSSLFEVGESARFRHPVEPLIWLLVALALESFLDWRRRLLAAPS